MPARDKGTSKSKAAQPTLASFYKLDGNGNGTPDATDAHELIMEPSELTSPQHFGTRLTPELEDVDVAEMRPPLPSEADSASHTRRKKARPISDIPAPVLTARQRAKMAKQQKTPTRVVGPLDRLIVHKPTALLSAATSVLVEPATQPVPSSAAELAIPPQVINIDGPSPFPDSTNSLLHSTHTFSSSQEHLAGGSVIEIPDDTPERPQASAAIKVSQSTHSFFQARTRSKPTVTSGSAFAPLPAGREARLVIDLTSVTETPVRRRPPDAHSPAAAPWPSYLGDHTNVPPRPPNATNSSLPIEARVRPVEPDPFEDNWLSSMTFDAAGEAQGRPGRMGHPSPSAPISLDLLSHRGLATVDAKYLASLRGDHELWTTKYRPMSACEVLGNEHHAQYLKEWLLALELLLDSSLPARQSPSSEPNSKASNKEGSVAIKRPRVVRVVEKSVVKKRRKVSHGYNTDWVVSDDDEEELEINNADDDEDTFLASLAQISSRSSSPMKRFSVPPPNLPLSIPQHDSVPPRYDFSARLTNSLLIVGPTGCGKSAAVYACGEELGWGVLEVYPGMGRRAGSHITNLVEGVGKNHTLMAHGGGSSKLKAQPRAALGDVLDKLFFTAQPKPQSKANVIDLDSDDTVSLFSQSPKSPRTIAFDTTTKSGVHSQSKKVNQSIILLEEVDLLFQGESGFWQAVIDVIKESRRPVIMTCNDVKLVPVNDLPLQDILYFESCPVPGAVSYLRRISQVEGHELSSSVLELLYTMPLHRTNRIDYPDQPHHPFPSQQPCLPDLRHALLQLQMICNTSPPPDIGTLQASSPWEKIEMLAAWSDSTIGDAAMPITFTSESPNHATVETLRGLAAFMDNVSFANCIDQRVQDEIEAQLSDQYETLDDTELDAPTKVRPDDTVGHHIVRKPQYRESARVLPRFSCENDMAIEVIARSRRLLLPRAPGNHLMDTSLTFPDAAFSGSRLFADRAAYQAKTLLFLEQLLAASSPLLPRPAIFLDYVPWITTMVRFDDAEEQAEDERIRELRAASQSDGALGPGKLRQTRNSLRRLVGAESRQWGGKFSRYLDLDEEMINIVHETALSWKE